jgi:hypothetical protein
MITAMRVLVAVVAVLGGCSTVSGLDDFTRGPEGPGGGGAAATGGNDTGGETPVGGGGFGGGKGECPAPWEPSANGNCYLLEAVHTWPDAMVACDDAGGHLAALTTVGEIAEVESTLSLTGDHWIGGQRDTGDQFKWITGESWDYVNGEEPWSSSSEPNNDGGMENCVELRAGDGLNDRPCDAERTTVCEWRVGG